MQALCGYSASEPAAVALASAGEAPGAGEEPGAGEGAAVVVAGLAADTLEELGGRRDTEGVDGSGGRGRAWAL